MDDDKVLIVEDDCNLLETLKYYLRKEGYDLVTAMDGTEQETVSVLSIIPSGLPS